MNRRALGLLVALLTTPVFGQTPEAKQVEIYGQKISYFEVGSGTPVILLHGMGANKNVWRFTIPTLSSKFHVYAIDMIGFGASDKPLLKYRVATFTDFLDEFMHRAGIAKAILVGNSLGGWVAADFAIRHPDEVDRLVLVDAAGYFTDASLKKEDLAFLNPSTLDETRILVKRVFYSEQLHSDAVVQRIFSERVRAGDGYTIDQLMDSVFRREDALNDRLGNIRAPTLVVSGREDSLIPVAVNDEVASKIPGAKKVIIDRCGHAPEIECPPPFEKALIDFLSATPSQPPRD